ncbi:MAG: bifunctional diaminohydroxyphosphoribosylaminopyrimidine deaminase/5-amino-6-(5-phosphoribosylamino)uracil reductase RibD [Clostridia bacterium]|nr:bifunctional diaminohydroxyphosphoribosylaminopyrimidine deaminase/5-amino-6-(5-phosphoribosylamino)uracil reductase RibD [Clostridia bacterium]MDD4571982.1 bifunctional diaminohydroxyphosphoribosylaminopyrimidine deaminase/5-amino-6-(5-phosphoribosylamino)uracil reductase RibD [Clostridia bacterium]
MNINYMQRAIKLAEKGAGYTNPNPMVGAVIVKNGQIIGEGRHEIYGGNHAEINAFNSAVENVTGAEMYVTLEPCSHYGKTPPCAEAIVKKGIKKVIVGALDPNPLVAGKGIKILKENGIEVIIGVMEQECCRLNEIFFKYITTHSPFCIMKTAMTLDGKIASFSGDSKWVTGALARKQVHWLRHKVSGIMVGIGTVLYDDPMLTTRLENKKGKDPARIIVDSTAKIPLEAKVLNLESEAPTIIATTEKAEKTKIKSLQQKGAQIITTPLLDNGVDLKFLMQALGEQKIDSVLLEGGSTLNYSALNQGIVDKLNVFIAPKIIGGANAKTAVGGHGKELMEEAFQLSELQVYHFGNDILLEGYIRGKDGALCSQA